MADMAVLPGNPACPCARVRARVREACACYAYLKKLPYLPYLQRCAESLEIPYGRSKSDLPYRPYEGRKCAK